MPIHFEVAVSKDIFFVVTGEEHGSTVATGRLRAILD